jgi:integrase
LPQVLNARTVETIKSSSKRDEIPDRHTPGLYLIVQPSGAKSWAVRYRHSGVTRKHTLGAYPGIDLKHARLLAAKALRTVAEGRDPGQEKARQREAEADSVAAVVEKFLRLHCARNNRPRTAEETERLLNLHVLPHWRRRRLREIIRRDVIDLLDRIVEAGKPIAANRTFAAVRKLFNWAVARDIIPASPCAGVKAPSPERARDRILNDEELRFVWLAADAMGGPFGRLIKLLILTAQRRDEVAKMQWSELNLRAALWTLPGVRTKNNEPHQVPLSDHALAVLTAPPCIANSDFVLTTSGTVPARGYAKNKRILDSLLPEDMPAWRLHDLRRTAATGLARLGVDLPVIEKILNHRSGSFASIVGVYQLHSFAAEKATALQRWGNHVEQLVSGESAQVLPLRGR